MRENVRILQELCRLSFEAKKSKKSIRLSAQQVRNIAKKWFSDQEKIRYLESLLLRKE